MSHFLGPWKLMSMDQWGILKNQLKVQSSASWAFTWEMLKTNPQAMKIKVIHLGLVEMDEKEEEKEMEEVKKDSTVEENSPMHS